MRVVAFAIVYFVVSGCSTSKSTLAWRVREMALIQTPTIALHDKNEKIVLIAPTQTIQKLLLSHIRITRSAGIQADLFIVEGNDPNAFAGLTSSRRIIGINIAMFKLIGDDMDEFAALLGHEAAHWAKGHVDARKSRNATIQGIGTLIGAGLGLAGVPGAGYITGLGADLIEASYSRDDEREADALSIDYMVANGFDPDATIRLHEKMSKLPGSLRLPFLSSHPSGEERIDNLKKLIAEKKYQPGVNQPHDQDP
jgi:predicted Zn-dependent protease